MSTLASTLLNQVPRILHGFGNQDHPTPIEFEPYWSNRAHKKQVHGTEFAEASEINLQLGNVDSVITRSVLLPLPIVTADCVPILMAREDGGMIAGTHSGWRGTLAGALRVLWSHLIDQGEHPANWIAAIGPAIGPCCYQVSPEIAQNFKSTFVDHGANLAVPKDRHLDLPAIQEAELKSIGLNRIDLIRVCTLCNLSPKYNSYRRDGGNLRQLSVIMRCKK